MKEGIPLRRWGIINLNRILTMTMLKAERDSLKLLAERLRNVLGSNLIYFFAFGSRVRGDFHWESDFDLLVVVKEKNYSTIKLITDICYSVEEETGIPYSAVVKDIKVFNAEKKYKTGFYRNLKEEGIAIYGEVNH